jgi:sugar transferase (PEP-CTERM system associated)
MIRIFPVYVPSRILALVISDSVLIFGAFYLATIIILSGNPDRLPYVFLEQQQGWFNIGVSVLCILIGLYLQDLYSDIYVKSRIVLLQQLCLAIGIAFLLQGFVGYLNRDALRRMPLHIMGLGGGMSMAGLFLWRVFYSAWVLKVVGRDRLLLVGGSTVLLDIAQHIDEHPEMGLMVTGYVDDFHDAGSRLPGGKVLGAMASLREIVEATQPTRVVVGMSERRNRVPVSELLELRFAGHLIEEAATAYERVCGRVCVKELRPSQLIYTGELGPRKQNVLYKNLASLVLGTVLIVLSIPLMILTALAVRLSSPGPILYRQSRVGLDGVPFTLLKFRSMRENAEAATGAVWATADDPRVTRVGRVLRKMRLDEMPQLFNVLRGEMAIVGPRPERPEFVKALSEQIPYYRQRHCVRPGITGWAQINYKYGDTLEDTISKLEYDLFYIKNMSASLDTYIIFHTLKAMLLSRGAQ